MPNPRAKKQKTRTFPAVGKTELSTSPVSQHFDTIVHDDLITDMFTTYLGQLYELHERKSKDYGTHEDPLNNIRASEKLGIPAWKGALLRMGDKFARLQKFSKNGKLSNESAIDSLNDIAVYALICRQMLEEDISELAKFSGGINK